MDETRVDVGVTQAEDLVDYRLDQAHFSEWLAQMSPGPARDIRIRAIEAIRPMMRPYQPIVVILTALVRS